jgi:ABC-type polysaccharide/polyol phosphate export permease
LPASQALGSSSSNTTCRSIIGVIRSRLLDEVPPLSHYLTVMATTAVGFGLAYLVHRKMRRQLAFLI